MPVPPLDPRALREILDRPEVRVHGDATLHGLRDVLADARLAGPPDAPLIVAGGRRLGRVLPHGTVVLDRPGALEEPPRRVLEMDRHGQPTLIVRRGPGGELGGAWVRNVDGRAVGIERGGATHPSWGASDRVVRFGTGGDSETVTVFEAVDWRAIATIPPLAEPRRLPAGAGTSLLNVLAAVAAEQGVAALRYRGPYATEQLFWALIESFRHDPEVRDPLPVFLDGAEAAFVRVERREAALDWIPSPYERSFEPEGVYVQLRDGVEKVWWKGRAYYRQTWQGLTRQEPRRLRRVEVVDGGPLVMASLWALGEPLEDHLVLDDRGIVLERRAVADAGSETDVEADLLWREALGHLVPLESTPLLASSLEAVWPAHRLAWGPVAGDLAEAHGETIRLSLGLARRYAARRAGEPAARLRGLAQLLVRDVLSVVGPVLRSAAATWLEAQPAGRRGAELVTSSAADRLRLARHAGVALHRLLDALTAGEALPPLREVGGAKVPTKLRRPPRME